MSRIVKTAAVTALVIGTGMTLERIVAAPHYHGPHTDHFDGTRFYNIERLDPHGIGDVLKWQLADRNHGYWREWVDAPYGPPPERRVADGRIRVTHINHATMLIQMDGFNILTDPIWSERCSPVQWMGPKRHRPPGIRFRDLPPIDLVLVSHNHYDHLDIGTLHMLRAKFGPRIVTPLGNAALMARQGIPGATQLDWWKSVDIGDAQTRVSVPQAGVPVPHLTITVVPAQHFCARAISDRNRNLWGGFVISGPSGNVYFSGDTGWGPHFAMIREKFGPIRLAMLPIGAYLPRWFMKPVHVDPAEAVEAHKVLGAQTSVAMHYGTFDLGDDGETQPVEDLKRAIAPNGNPNFLVLEHGIGHDVR